MSSRRFSLSALGWLAIVALGQPIAGCRGQVAKEDRASAPAASAATAAATLRWNDGELDVYTVDLGSKLRLDSTAESGLELSLKGKLALAPQRQAPETVDLVARLDEIDLRMSRGTGPVDADQVKAELARPALIRLASGRLEDVRVSSQSSALVVSVWQTLAATLQLVAGQPGASRWQAKENDAAGAYSVEYNLLAPSRLKKKKLDYAGTPVKEARFGIGLDLKPKVLESDWTVELDHGRLQGVVLRERLQVSVGASAASQSENHVTLRHQARAAAPAVDHEQLWSATSSVDDLQRRLAAEPGSRERDMERARNTSFEQTLQALEQQERDPEAKKLSGSENGRPIEDQERKRREARVVERAKAFTDMVALLRVEPKTITRALASISRQSPAAARLQDALASAGTPETQAALVRIARNKALPDNARLSAATSLIRVQQPTEQTITALLQAIDDDLLVTHAVYGLGTMARHLRDLGDGARVQRISQALLDFLRSTSTDSQRVRALRAIANSGHAGAFQDVRPLLDAKARDVRGAALEALRHMDHPEVDGILAARLASETDSEVRLAALNAIKTRRPGELLARALIAAASDPQPRVRSAVARLMSSWKDARPELVGPLSTLAAKDQIDWVRDAAQAESEPTGADPSGG